MSERFTEAKGRRVVSRASAEELGRLEHIVVDPPRAQIVSLVVGRGRKAMIVAWEQVSGFGPDAMMVADEESLHPPSDDHQRDAAAGKLELIGRPVLDDMGNDLGTITDIVFDPVSGAIETLVFGAVEEPGSSLLGAGSYAAVVRARTEPPPDVPAAAAGELAQAPPALTSPHS